MIYDFPEPASPISQGDIFTNIPILDLADDALPVTDDKGNVQMLPWEDFASAGETVSSIIAVRPTIAIVGTQECDALRAPNITLFEVRPFRDVERKSKDTSKPSKWVPIITQHARINQKWFYLPIDEKVGFSEKMGADFLTPIRIPRIALERLINFRKARLNEIAKQHFRERLAEFFRRYAYDEWYPLTREELAEYQKNYPDAEPFPWQRETSVSDKWKINEDNDVVEISKDDGEKGDSDYVVEWNEAVSELTTLLSGIATELETLTFLFNQHTESFELLERKGGDYYSVAALAASNMNYFSNRVETVLPKFEKNIQVLERSYSAYVSFVEPESRQDVEQIWNSHKSLSETLNLTKSVKDVVIGNRDVALSMKDSNINEELNSAASRKSEALDSIVSNMEELESFILKMQFLIDEKFGKPPASEDKAE